MKLLDVNVLVNALRTESPHHQAAFDFVASARRSAEPVVILPEVAAGFMRIVTRRDLFADPEPSSAALDALRVWCAAPSVRVREAGPGRWLHFENLMAAHELVGGDIHDALLAAACLDFRATLVTSDHGFARFPGLNVQRL